MLGVIILHYNNSSIGKAFSYAPLHSLRSYALYFFQSMSISAVDVFVLISGYFMCKATKVDLKKPVRLLIQVVVFREMIYITQNLLQGNPLRWKWIWQLLFPKSWFAVLYAALYVLSPFINRLLSSLSDKRMKTFMWVMFILCSLWPYCVDLLEAFSGYSFDGLSTVGMYGSQFGYTLVHFVLMYCVGAWLRRFEGNSKLWQELFVLLSGWVVLFVFSYYLTSHKMDIRYAFSYGSPLVITNAVCLFRLFKRIPLKNNRVINSMATATFSVYLLNSAIISELLDTKKYVQSNGWLMLAHMAFACVLIFLISYGAQLLYDLITKPIYKLTDKLLPFNTVIRVDDP
jgi:surface polysaccharide O-acyltransferase-like enzyme